MSLGRARRNEPEVAQTGGPGAIVSFDWHGCAAHLEATKQPTIERIERFLALPARHEDRLSPSSDGAVVSVRSEDGGALVRTGAWQAWAAGDDQLTYLILEALGQVFIEAYAGTVFHAAAFEHDRGTVVIHGPAQSGKTSLLYRAWRRGFTVISDDRVALEADCQTVQAFPRCLKLRCHGDAEAAALASGIPSDLFAKAAVGPDRRIILARTLPGFLSYGETRPIRALVQVERTADETQLEAIEPSAALSVALRNIVSSDFNPTAVVHLIKSQADQGSLYRLRIGPDQIDAALDLLAEI